ncbi:acyltransferase family protein [Nocardioides sp. CFH 31398]|uniref:acyltransferase family protein n=1 Tax=Nocardioides sp. CFH 31398 TaxID=2919579 RepID=UPI001F056EAB|nr:acyltransferase family protein [Nocardioides sp. CFH 31398]MCH1865991.1 acyltransferase [Nocardioides sp. CFH 31398]
MSDPAPVRSGFRDDIQGMRALAVLAIILFHAGLSPYPGGFVTLDVFFVLSGFLITLLLLREVERDGTVSLRRFYARRARRILPAASVVAVAVVAASALWLDVVRARETAVDAIWSAFFAANVRFALVGTDYFADEAPPSPMQHYWSLAVEEQFYLLLPVLLVACVWLAARRSFRPRLVIGVALSVMTAVSLAWSMHASTASPEMAYFSTLTRTWEFGAGALLALAAPVFGRLGALARNLLATGGLLAIAVACFVVTERTPFPGYAALLPVLGTGAVMVAGTGVTGRPPVMQRALGVAPLRLVGDMSYSLYLWHWPMLVVAAGYVGRPLTLFETGPVVGLAFALSWLTYRYVETPFRSYAPGSRQAQPTYWRQLVLYPASLVLVVTGAGAGMAVVGDGVEDGAPITTARFDRAPGGKALSDDDAVALVEASLVAARQGADIPADLRPTLLELQDDKAPLGACDYDDAGPWELCTRGDRGAEKSIVLLGNSHGRHWIPAFERLAQREGYRTHYLVKAACTPARVVSVARNADRPWGECTAFNTWAQQQVEELEPDVVVIAGSAPRGMFVDGEFTQDPEVTRRAMYDGYRELVDDVVPHAGEVVMLGDVPRRQDDPVACLGRSGASLQGCLTSPAERAATVTEESRRATLGTGARFVDTEPWFCADGRCPAVIGDFIPMRDQGHISTAYAEHLAGALARALRSH